MYGVRLTASATFPKRKLWLPWLLSCGRVNRAEINITPTGNILPKSANIHHISDSNSFSRITHPSRLQCSFFTLLCLSALLLVHGPFDDTSPLSSPLVSPTIQHHLVTSPLIFSEFNLSSKYLQWTNEYDVVSGISHRFHSWGCALGEAVTLDRTFLFPARFKVPSKHNHGRPHTEKDTRLYIDLPRLHREARLIEEAYFQQEWEKLIPTTPTLSVLEVGFKHNTSFLREDRSDWMLLRRTWENLLPMYSKCYPHRFEVKGMEWVPHDNNVSPNPIPKTLIYRKSFTTSDDGDEAGIPSVFTHMEYAPLEIPIAAPLVDIGELIKTKLGLNYTVVHVRRGDKMYNSHPTLDNDTRPEELKRKLPKWIPRGTHVYLATNEDGPNFFDALKELYLTSTLADFRNLWAEGSNWWKDTSHFRDAGDADPFDGMMEGIVDYIVMKGASTLVETFGMLSPGNRHFTTANDISEWNSVLIR